MQRYIARVRNGRLTLDEPTDLPEGTEVELVIVDYVNDEMDAEERAALDAELEAACDEVDRGEVVEASVVFAEMEALVAARMLKAPA